MSEAPKSFEKVAKKWQASLEEEERIKKRKYVPEEFENSFQAMALSGGIFRIGGLDYAAVCLKCGAMVYPSALDRHSTFHENLKEEPHD